jgi:hypothetical protein
VKNWSETLLSRFSNSTILVALISSFDAAMDPAADIAAFLQYIWNVRSAVGNGLNIWGKIVGIARVIPSSPPITLSDFDYQTLILIKAAANIGNVTIPTLNRLLTSIFGSYGIVYVQDNLNMTITYVFNFPPTTAQLAFVGFSGALPRPAGVLVNVTWPFMPSEVFGFDSNGPYVAGFDTGAWDSVGGVGAPTESADIVSGAGSP